MDAQDFPPALVRELHQGMRTPMFMILTSLLPTALALLFSATFIEGPKGEVLISPESLNGFFQTLVITILLFLIPFRAMNSVLTETVTGNKDLLILTRLTPWKIIFGKWTSCIAQVLLFFCIALPFELIRYFYGNVDILEDLLQLIYIVLGAGLLTSIFLWNSGMPSLLRSMGTLGTYGLGILFTVATLGLTKEFVESDDWFSCIVFAVDVLAITTSFLLLARYWFAAPSQNMVLANRILLLVGMLFGLVVQLPIFPGVLGHLLFSCMTAQWLIMFFWLAVYSWVGLIVPALVLPPFFLCTQGSMHPQPIIKKDAGIIRIEPFPRSTPEYVNYEV